MQHTLALIKPDAAHHADEIVDAIQQAGFKILNVNPTFHSLSNFVANDWLAGAEDKGTDVFGTDERVLC